MSDNFYIGLFAGLIVGFLLCATLVGLRNPQILKQAREGRIT